MKEHPEHLAKDNLLDWISNDDGKTYNRCVSIEFVFHRICMFTT